MISKKISDSLKHSSWIRAMFEEGERLRTIYGEDNVYDFTLGNPDVEPPEKVKNTLKDIVLYDIPGVHRYMNNAGFTEIREKIAQYLSKETGISIPRTNIVMTCGAAGGLNVVLKTILNPGEKVIVLAPYFAEYLFYIDNHGGIPIVVPPDPSSFEPDLEKFSDSITSDVKAIIINSPNNPTGIIYSKQALKNMAEIIRRKQKQYKNVLYVISDEPYNKLVYNKQELPSILNIFNNSIIINSFSKSLALPGERIGYIAVNPNCEDLDLMMDGLIFANRTLGFVNAPALFQKVIGNTLDVRVDIDEYRRKRDILYSHMTKLGFQCVKPQGAFYLFPKSPIDNDVEFIKHAIKYNILLVPGQGFGYPGYFRISYSVSMKTIENSLSAFEALANDFM